ncbi:MAG: thioredoxin family protein [Candidatus Andersenbacteria bacterium]
MQHTVTREKGFATLIGLIVVMTAIAIGAAYFVTTQRLTTTDSGTDTHSVLEQAQELEKRVGESNQSTEVLVNNESGAQSLGHGEAATYTGAVLAGEQALLLEFNQADYARALASENLVVLYFYANWCPICREEFPKMQAAFDELTTPGVVGFRVNFNDNQTDDQEKSLAREHGIAYQHTKVFIKGGQRILKSPETWAQARYLTEITAAAQ